MKVYYAHFMGTYNTPVEERDIQTLSSLGLEVINPNCKETSEKFRLAREASSDYMEAFNVFFDLVKDCDVFAFRALPDGRVPGGVYMELGVAMGYDKTILELPCGVTSRGMTGEETREYLRDMGQR